MFRKIKRKILRYRDVKALYRDWRSISLIKKSDFYDADWYLETYPDVKAANINPAVHYYMYGALEGRNPSPLFNTLGYLTLHPDVRLAGMNPLIHFLVSGEAENRLLPAHIPTPVSTPVPAPVNATVKSSPVLNEKDFFDVDWYRSQNGESIEKSESPFDHYMSKGWKLGFDPSEKFSTSRYRDFYRDVKAANINPLTHYVRYGITEGRLPLPPKRIHNTSFVRLTPDEIGTPDIILNYDAPLKPIKGIEKERIAVHLHLYHTDMIEDFVRYLCNIRQPFTLLISIMNCTEIEQVRNAFSTVLPHAKNIIVRATENRGRDVAPWVVLFRDEIIKSTIFLHVHTKKSLHNKSHSGWFRYLNHVVLGSPSTVNQILQSFVSDPEIGIIAPCYHWSLAKQPNYGKNKHVCQEFFQRLSGQDIPEACHDYPAGSFFWVRTKALQPLFDLDINNAEFPEENGQVDGTIAHAIERVIGLLPSLSEMSYKKATVNIAYDLVRYFGDNRKVAPEPTWRSKYPTTKKLYDEHTDRIAVFSCLSGGYEQAIPLIDNDENIDKFLIVDREDVVIPEGYTKIVSNYINPQSVLTARFAKTHPHVWFKDYDFVFWIDSNVHFLGDLRNYVQKLKSADADCGFIIHPVRDNFIEESEILSASRIVDHKLATRQVSRYLADPKLLSDALFETNFMVCRPQSETVQKFMGTWWSEINKYTHRDQLSVNYAARTTNLKWVPLLDSRRSTRDHSDFILFSHKNSNRDDIISTIKNS